VKARAAGINAKVQAKSDQLDILHAVGVPDGCRSKYLVGQAVHPARNIRVGDPGQGHEFPSGDGARPRSAPSLSASAAPEAPASAVATRPP
jgi:hypothetical protein